MDDDRRFTTIDSETFKTLLEQYPDVVPAKLKNLEERRLETIPKAVRSQDPSYFTKVQLVTLMDWKLSHGKFRPALPKLIKENNAKVVQAITQNALEQLRLSSKRLEDVKEDGLRRCLDELCKLRGVGPATASLLMSVYDSDRLPFFSDELYRWLFWDEPMSAAAAKKGSGWSREIKYDVKAYMALFSRFQKLRKRMLLDHGMVISALDAEKVAYVLGKQGQAATKDAGSSKKAGPARGKKRKAAPEPEPEPVENDDDTAGKETAEEPDAAGTSSRPTRRRRKAASG
jgi:hypothetical protein